MTSIGFYISKEIKIISICLMPLGIEIGKQNGNYKISIFTLTKKVNKPFTYF